MNFHLRKRLCVITTAAIGLKKSTSKTRSEICLDLKSLTLAIGLWSYLFTGAILSRSDVLCSRKRFKESSNPEITKYVSACMLRPNEDKNKPRSTKNSNRWPRMIWKLSEYHNKTCKIPSLWHKHITQCRPQLLAQLFAKQPNLFFKKKKKKTEMF